MPKTSRGNRFWCSLPSSREINFPRQGIGSRDALNKRLYAATSVRKEFIYNYDNNGVSKECTRRFHGGIFNLSFSPNGSVLVAATERKSLLFFDPFSHKLVNTVEAAHKDSVNYVKFLDSRLFATCSDDSTVAIWDLRNLKNKLKCLRGHSYWVKNIEYDEARGLLLSSSYDGCVNLWDINKTASDDDSEESASQRPQAAIPESAFPREFELMPRLPSLPNPHPTTEVSSNFERVLYLSCIMRMRLTHDASKMVVCTSEGYMMVIHDLDLTNLAADLSGFQSDLYRLMQKGHSCGLDFGSWYNKLFNAKRNRVELISDFPKENDAHSITSLDVHPHNWAILSRNISRDENSEFTCVHDIQGDRQPSELVPIKLPKDNVVNYPNGMRNNRAVHLVPSDITPNFFPRGGGSASAGSSRVSYSSSGQPRNTITISSSSGSPSILPSSSSFTSTITNPINAVTESSPPLEMHVSPVVIISARSLNRRAHATILNPNTSYRAINPDGDAPPNIYKNINRLTHYASEVNVGQGFIKELCFSPDGRVICSPYDHGYRILAFNQSCSELSDVGFNSSSTVQPLYDVRSISPHANYVVTTKFSPTHLTIASGCLSGRVVFSQPVL